MKTLFILNDSPYGSERSFNALRLAGALAKRDDARVRVFLMGDAAACAQKGQRVPEGYYNINRMLQAVAQHDGEIGVCGTCMDARGIAADDLVDGARRGTLDQLATWTAEADQVLAF